MPNQVAIRLATDGSAQVKADFADIAASGDASAQRLVKSYARAGEDIDKALDRRAAAEAKLNALAATPLQRQIEAVNGTNASGSVETDLSSQTAQSKARNATAADWSRLLAEQEKRAEALRTAIDPLYAAQKRYDAEVEASGALLRQGAITEQEHAKAIDLSTAALQRSRQAAAEVASPTRETGDQDTHVTAYARAMVEQQRQAEALRAAIDPVYTAQKRYDAEIETAAGLLKQGAISEAEYSKAVDLSTAALQRSRQAAAEAASPTRETGDQDAHVTAYARAMVEQQRQAEALRGSIDPLYAAQKRFDQELEVATNLFARGAITEEEFNAAVTQSGATLQRTTRNLEEHGGALALNRTQALIAEGAVHRYVDSLAAGMSPGRAFILQAGDIGNILAMDDGGVAGGLAKVRALVTPVTVGVTAIAAAFIVAGIAGLSYANAIDKLTTISQGAGRVIGANASLLEANAEAAAKAGNISVSSARDIEAGYVQMGGIGTNVLTGLTAITGQFAAATGQDGKAALQQLGSAFQDPVKGAQELASRYGFLTQAQIEHIQKLVEQNDLYGAQAALLTDLKGPLDGAADHVNILAEAWRFVKTEASDAWTAMGKAIDRALGGGTTADEIAALQQQRLSLLASNANGAIAEIDQRIAAAQARLKTERASDNGAAGNKRAQDLVSTLGIDPGGDDKAKSELVAKLASINGVLGDTASRAALTAAQIAQLKTKQDEYTHAVQSYLPEGEKAVRLAQLDAQIAAANKDKNPRLAADLAAQKAQVEQDGKLVTSSQATALAAAAGDRARTEATKGADKHAKSLAREAAAEDASARAALVVAAAYLESGAAGAEAEARRKALTDATKKGIDVEAEVRRQLALSVGQAAETGAKSVSQLKEETAARTQVDYAVKTSAIGIGQMSQALGDENALRDLTVKQALAYKLGLTSAYDAITATIQAYKQALSEAHEEEAHSQALQSLDALRKRVEDAQLAVRYAGDQTGAGDLAKAALTGSREADARGYSPDDRAAVVTGNTNAAAAELEAKRAATVAEMLTGQRDANEQANLQLSTVGKSAVQQQVMLDRLQAEQRLRAAGVDLASDQARQVLAGVDAEDALKAKLALVQSSMQEVDDLGSKFIDDLTNPDGSGIKNLLKDVEQELIKLAAINPLKNLLTGSNLPTLSSVGGLFSQLLGGSVNLGSLSEPALNIGGGAAASFSTNGFDFSSLLTHFAAGSDYTSGGAAWVGENGPEIVNLPQGSRVTNASDTRRLMSASNDVGARTVHNHFTGNLLTPEFWAQIQAGDDNAASRGATGGAQMSGQNLARARRRSLVR